MKNLYEKFKNLMDEREKNDMYVSNHDTTTYIYTIAKNDGKIDIEAKAGDWIFESEDGTAFIVKKEVVDEYYDEIEPVSGDLKKSRVCPFDENNKHEDITMVGIEKWFSPKPPVFYGKQLKEDLKTHIDYKKSQILGLTGRNELFARNRNSQARFLGDGNINNNANFNICKSNQLPSYKDLYDREQSEQVEYSTEYFSGHFTEKNAIMSLLNRVTALEDELAELKSK